MKDVMSYIDSNRDRYLKELKEFLEIPSISTGPSYVKDVKIAAEYVAQQLKKAGMSHVKIFPTPGHPVVYGEHITDKKRPTLLVYGHYDVQPVDPVALWTSPPFEPTVRNGELYARGAADDKGQMFIHFKSAEAYMECGKQLPVNIKYLIEGEEEIGSPNLDSFIADHKDLLMVDAVMVSDTTMFARGIPSICYGLRGLVYFQIDASVANRDLHSGSFGGAVGNPAFELSNILAAIKDVHGRITIPHFYDDVRELTDRERQEFARLPFNEKVYAGEIGVKQLSGEHGYTPLEQLWARPTFEINGLLSGFTGEGAKTVLPAKAMAKVSLRLVPDQKPEIIEDLFEHYVYELAPSFLEIKVTRMHGGKPWITSLDHPALLAASRAIKKGFGKEPVFQREGGSIPVVATFSEQLGIPSVLFGIGLPDENAHAPNEKLDLENFYNGIRSSAYFLDELAQIKPTN